MFIDKSMTREVITIQPEASIVEASERMEKHRVHQLPVVDQENVLLGIVTDRDIRSALPSDLLYDEEALKAQERASAVLVKDVMAKNVYTVSPANTLEDALLLMERKPVGAFPVVDEKNRVIGIISVRDLMRSFVNVLGIHEPGTLLCILAEDKLGTMKRIVDAISEERIPFGSILVARHWEEGKRAVFPYLLTLNVAHVKRKLEGLGFKLLNPMEWYLDQLPKKS
ncbi:MAG: CBS domain-containing protein [Syntrophobacteraceae bacterium]|nr:CBS domain-containing protein [Syntrophobacteraceae bacterium]